jgi:glyoxylase-like metal-dependent hydrolase (beta-lactamase superfamily II)
VKVEMFNVGWISAPAVIYRQGEDPSSRLRFPVPAYLIETDRERILVDTGLHPGAVADPLAWYERPEAATFELELEGSIADQVDLATVTRLVLTHLHFDHAGAVGLLPPSVPIVLQRREWEAGHDDASVRRNFFYPRDYDLEGRELVLVDGDHDLLGDGSVELLLTPGHTPGHQSVRVGQTLILGVDVGHFASTIDDLRFPSFADDFEAQAASAARLRERRDAGMRVVPGHDPDVLRPGPVAL